MYSLGCVLYEMLAGLPPFQGRSATTLLARHSLEQVPSLTIVRTTIPPELEDTVLRALAKIAADRYTMAELAEALRQLEAERAEPAPHDHQPSGPGSPAPGPVVSHHRHHRCGHAAGHLGQPRAARPGPSSPPATAPAPLDPRQIAVLYFDQRPRADSLEYLADGITEG